MRTWSSSIRLHRMISWCLIKLSILPSRESEELHIFATPEYSMRIPSLSSSQAGSGLRDTKVQSTACSSGIKHLKRSSMLLITTSLSSSASRPEKVLTARARRLYSSSSTPTDLPLDPIHSLMEVRPEGNLSLPTSKLRTFCATNS